MLELHQAEFSAGKSWHINGPMPRETMLGDFVVRLRGDKGG